ncbi:hypothetical protein KZD03_20895 [Escherichia coli]|uniref:hypothetical protein n=1 Tax=Klebsiella pneumoniae TaxID=573 RepID=UPI0007CA2575|nr:MULTISPECIES: hypothetical protein [Enterobacteriaceae]MCA0142716.1 hypothetical protein [Escherichia coli]MIQ93471.1 hypothetical protein [Salmonella enterica subsp. enterica serovar Enteritidis]SAT96513.1 Uncharacterised protein [Klebsiella pneumoniae]SAU58921.1 Uncharacterised protein [Klebsiella pneumoniae]
MNFKTFGRILACILILVALALFIERAIWKFSDAYPSFLAGTKQISSIELRGSFRGEDARFICGLKDDEDTYENADVAFKENGTFVRCENLIITHVYKVVYASVQKR